GLRLKEAAKLGFARAFAPAPSREKTEDARVTVAPIGSVASLIAMIAAAGVEASIGRAKREPSSLSDLGLEVGA
ncbi:MAG: hypothetical protein JOZ35_24395, partial [Hyphomicrobiales bacterium]|nr:hypothetical protein [Hyphomicrobiales bacterium]